MNASGIMPLDPAWPPARRPTALIMGNGPSIDRLDPALFEHFETYGTNHIYKKFPTWGRAVDNVVITDSNRLQEIGAAYRDFPGNLFVGDQRYIAPPVTRLKRLLGRDFHPLRQLTKQSLPVNFLTERIRWSKYLFATVFDKTRFSFSSEKGLNFGPSVVISAIQIAVMRGSRTVLLTGVDSNYSTSTSYFAEMKNSVQYVNDAFISNPRLHMEPQLVALQVCFEGMGTRLVDCTPDGRLRFIEKASLPEFIFG